MVERKELRESHHRQVVDVAGSGIMLLQKLLQACHAQEHNIYACAV